MSRQPPPAMPPVAARPAPSRPALWQSWHPTPTAMIVALVGLAVMAGSLAWALAVPLLNFGRFGVAIAAALGAVVAALPMALLAWRAAQRLEQGRHLALAAGALDPVTGVSSRAPFLALAEREFARSRRYGIGAGLLLVDIDRFRRVVEGSDPEAGDLVLREIAASIQATLRGADALARFGHAQIAVFLAHADPLGALDVAERIRERIELLEIAWRDQRLRVTVSVGVVMMRPAHLSLQAVIDDAEAALGAARHAGGNCVRSAPVDPRRLPQGSHGPSIDDNQAAS